MRWDGPIIRGVRALTRGGGNGGDGPGGGMKGSGGSDFGWMDFWRFLIIVFLFINKFE